MQQSANMIYSRRFQALSNQSETVSEWLCVFESQKLCKPSLALHVLQWHVRQNAEAGAHIFVGVWL